MHALFPTIGPEECRRYIAHGRAAVNNLPAQIRAALDNSPSACGPHVGSTGICRYRFRPRLTGQVKKRREALVGHAHDVSRSRLAAPIAPCAEDNFAGAGSGPVLEEPQLTAEAGAGDSLFAQSNHEN